MPTRQTEYITMLGAFARLFSKRIWEHAKVLLVGAILCPAERTVTAALRVMGLRWEKHFQNYHRVLNRAGWSSLEASRILFRLLINTFVIRGPLILGLDDTIERRRGAKIKAKACFVVSLLATKCMLACDGLEARLQSAEDERGGWSVR